MPNYVLNAAWYVPATRTMHLQKHIREDLQDRQREHKKKKGIGCNTTEKEKWQVHKQLATHKHASSWAPPKPTSAGTDPRCNTLSLAQLRLHRIYPLA